MLAKIKEYFYEVDLSLNTERTGMLSSAGLPELEVATPPEFLKGKKNKWTPEHMLAGAVSSCFMTTYIAMAEKAGLDILGYKSHCFIKMEIKDSKLKASEILIRPTIKLISDHDLPRALELIENAEDACPVKNALRLNTEIHPHFEFLNRGERIKA